MTSTSASATRYRNTDNNKLKLSYGYYYNLYYCLLVCDSHYMTMSAGHGSNVDILIIGAGPTGLGAAARLEQRGHADWLLIEARDTPGGLAYTTVTPEGFLFDTGGHVIFSHYAFFDELVDAAVGGSGDAHWNMRRRVSHVLCCNKWVPYPFQNNLSFLPLKEKEECLLGAIDAAVLAATATQKPKNFDEWILRTMGTGIADVFMRPYNFKVWAVPPVEMQCDWLGERVATVDAKRLVSDALHNRAAEVTWGPNSEFRFPAVGGTGKIWQDVAQKLCGGYSKEENTYAKQRYGVRVIKVDTERKEVTVERDVREQGDGSIVNTARETIRYKRLLSTMPLDKFLELCDAETRASTVETWSKSENTAKSSEDKNVHSKPAAFTAAPPFPSNILVPHYLQRSGDDHSTTSGLFHSSSHIIGLGIRGTHKHGDKCWQYFPEENCPFYRCTVFTNYSDNHAPSRDTKLPTLIRGDLSSGMSDTERSGPYWSLMLEVSESTPYKPVDSTLRPVRPDANLRLPQIVIDTIQGCVATELMTGDDEIVSIHHERVEYGYPTPSLGRDAALDVTLPYLKERDVYSRGRFGAWKYEVANQDHSCMQGVEAVDNMLSGSAEITVNYPGIVNKRGGKNEDLKYTTDHIAM